MSDATENQTEPQTEVSLDELTLLKARADTMGLSYHPSIGLETLRKKVNDRLNGIVEPVAAPVQAQTQAEHETETETPAQLRTRIRNDALKLVRIRLTNMNPDKKELHGEFFTIANELIGDVKKFIPYGDAMSDDGYQVPNVIFEELKNRKFLQVKTRKDPKKPGHMIVDQKWVSEFAIEVLPQLTPSELKDLAVAQAAAGRVD